MHELVLEGCDAVAQEHKTESQLALAVQGKTHMTRHRWWGGFSGNARVETMEPVETQK